MKKHVYLINKGCRASEYGIGTYISEVVNALKEDSLLNITLIELDTKEKEVSERYDMSGRVRYLNFPSAHVRSEKEAKRAERNLTYLLSFYVDAKQYNIFHFNYLSHGSFAFLLKHKFPECRMIVSIHYLEWCFVLKGNASRFRSLLTKGENKMDELEKRVYEEFVHERAFFKMADRVICLAEFTRQLLLADYGIPDDKLRLIYNGMRDMNSVVGDDVPHNIANLPCNQQAKKILFVGRLDDIKGLDYLIAAFREVLKIFSDACLWIVGDGDYSTYLRCCADIWQSITFTGKVEKKKLYEFYQMADIGVIPSFHEQCSYVCIEMMMYGLPIIGSSSTGLSEMLMDDCRIELEETDTCVAFPVEELAQTLIRILGNQEEKEKLGMWSRQLFIKRHLLNRMHRQMIECYDSL